MRKRLLVLFGALFVVLSVSAFTGVRLGAFYDCCKETSPNVWTCEENACFFVHDCDDDEHCEGA